MEEWINNLFGFLVIILIIVIPIARRLIADIKKVQKRERDKRELPRKRMEEREISPSRSRPIIKPPSQQARHQNMPRVVIKQPSTRVVIKQPSTRVILEQHSTRPKQKVPITERGVKQDFAFHSQLEEVEDLSEISKHHLESKIDPYFSNDVTSEAFISEKGFYRQELTAIEKIEKKKDFRKKIILYKELIDFPKSY